MQHHFDRFAILLSSICAIHCIVLPVVITLIPFLATTVSHGHAIHEFWFHQFILLFIFPVSLIALISGYRCHHNRIPLALGMTGLGILVFTAVFAGYLIDHLGMTHTGETLLTVTGGTIHAFGHIRNVISSKKHHATCPIANPKLTAARSSDQETVV